MEDKSGKNKWTNVRNKDNMTDDIPEIYMVSQQQMMEWMIDDMALFLCWEAHIGVHSHIYN